MTPNVVQKNLVGAAVICPTLPTFNFMQLMVSYIDLHIKSNTEMQFKLCARPISANKGQCIYAIDSTEREIHYGDADDEE